MRRNIGQQGFVLLPVVLAVTLVAVVAFLLNRESAVNVRLSADELNSQAVRYIAAAGLDHTRWLLRQNTTCNGYTGLSDEPFSSGAYTTSITPVSGSPVAITAIGMAPDGSAHTVVRQDIKAYQPAITITLQPGAEGQDSFIEGANGHTDHNKGDDNSLETDAKSSDQHRALIRFDLSQLPVGATVLSATLELEVFTDKGDADAVEAHALLQDWTEADVTWENRDNTNAWNTMGGDYDADIAGSFITDGSGRYAVELTDLTRRWVSGSQANHGVILLSPDTSGSTKKKYGSSDSPLTTEHPLLTITYACECGLICTTGEPATPNLLLVVLNPASLTAQEAAKKLLIESWGYVVNLIGADDSQSEFDAAVTINEVAYISEDILSDDLGNKLTASTIGVVTEELNLTDEFGMAASILYDFDSLLTILDNSHYVTSPFNAGSLTILSNAQYLADVQSPISSDLQFLAANFYGPALVALETGALLYDGGTAAGRRVLLPWGDDDFDLATLNADGRVIMRRAIEWACGALCQETVVAPQPIAHWKLDESSGTTAQDSVSSHDGKLLNGPVWQADGRIDGALSFDGSDDMVSVPHSNALSLSSQFTISAWIRNESPDVADTHRILSKETPGANDAYWLSLQDGALWFGVGGEFYSPATKFSQNRWYHIAITFNDAANEVRAYVDSVEALNQSSSATMNTNSQSIQIGANWESTKFWHGQLDDIRIYDRALSASEIADIFSSEDTGSCSGTLLDEFGSVSYANSDGTLPWATDWLEINESNGPGSGDEQVRSDQGDLRLRVRDNDGGGEGVEREADLSTFTSATLTFDYRRKNLDNSSDYVSIDVSNNGGGSWTELERLQGPGSDTSYQVAVHDISAYISSNTRIRFLSSSSLGGTDELFFDNVKIELSGCVKN